MKLMIYELNQMIDYLDDFFESSHRVTMVGGIVGTPIEKFVLDAALKTTPFSKILVLNGCQDYIGFMKERLDNVLFYADILVSEILDSYIPVDVWKPSMYAPTTEYARRLNMDLLSYYDIIVVFNAHIVPNDVIGSLNKNFGGKIVYVVDPLETTSISGIVDNVYRHTRFNVPTIVDSLTKLSPIMAMARNVFGFETRAIDRRIDGTVTQVSKINKRVIGKIDNCQYITNDFQLFEDVQRKQINSGLRRNQKLIVSNGTDVFTTITTSGEMVSLVNGSMLVVSNANTRPLMQMRIYNSRMVCGIDVKYKPDINHSYENPPLAICPQGVIDVTPGNIMTAYENDVISHRFDKVVLILDGKLDRPSVKYSILKNTNNLIIVDGNNDPGIKDSFDDEYETEEDKIDRIKQSTQDELF